MAEGRMTDHHPAKDWRDQGLKALAKSGFTALKAEPLAKAMGVSRGSFYWHFADIGAFHAAILKHWREVAAEQIIAGLEAAAKDGSRGGNPISLLLRGAFGNKPALEKSVRSWATIDPKARAAVQAIDRRRVDYVEHMLRQAGGPPAPPPPPAPIPFLADLGLSRSDPPLPPAEHQAPLREL